jgi:hypothetical protein
MIAYAQAFRHTTTQSHADNAKNQQDYYSKIQGFCTFHFSTLKMLKTVSSRFQACPYSIYPLQMIKQTRSFLRLCALTHGFLCFYNVF